MEVLLFSHEPDYTAAALVAGIAGVIVDWEQCGKDRRQLGWDTQINRGGTAELRGAIAAGAAGQLICRINNTAPRLAREIDLAIEHGASEIWLPMVRSVVEVELALRRIDGAARLGVLAETREAMLLGRELQQLMLPRVYIGLHDYRIDCGHAGLFDPIVDGRLDQFREHYHGALGFAGVTDPRGGEPIPQRALLAAMARLDCSFGVARRRFRADVAPKAIPDALARIERELEGLRQRSPERVDADQRALAQRLLELGSEAPAATTTAATCAD